MNDLFTIDSNLAEKLGRERQDGHSENGTLRFFKDSAHEDILGIKAELAFQEFSGLNADLKVRPEGDGLKDFVFIVSHRRLTVDVKGARAPIFLLLKEKDAEKAADILVLAKVEGDEVWFLGWEHKSMMLISPKREFGYGIVSHYRHHSELRPMWQLADIITRREN